MGVPVGLDVADGSDFERREFEFATEGEVDRVRGSLGLGPGAAEKRRSRGPGARLDVNILAGKPVLVKVKRKAAEDDGERD